MIYLYILVMAVVTYLIRMLPLTLLRKPVKSRFLRSFLFYVPYACLTAMTVPAIFTCTQSPVSAIAGFAVAIVLGLRNKGLMTVAAAGCITVFAVERLLALLEKSGSLSEIIELENAYQLCTKQEYYEYLVNIALQPKKAVLSDVMMETLSIIAYKQPVTKIEIEKIRGVKSDHAVNKLIEYNLVQEVGRLDAPGRPILLGTTEEFLRNFGVDSTDNLPTINPVKLEDFKAEAEEEIQIRLDI